MSTVEDLERKEQSLLDQLKQVRESLERARQDALGVHIGDVVLFKGTPHRVSSFEMWPQTGSRRTKPWSRGYSQLKSGKWSKYTRAMYDEWERP